MDEAVPLSFAPSDAGILPDRMIAALAEAGGIRAAYPFASDQIQPASLDLRLGAVAYRVRASFLPGPGTTVAQRIAELKLHEFALAAGAVLETGCVYIVPLIESLALPADIAAATNPKSSTGRLDVFTRMIADETRGFDRVEGGYHGPLYAEISPKTFPVLVRQGTRLSQLRLRRGAAALSADALRALHARERLVDRTEAVMGDGVAVSIDLAGANGRAGVGGVVGYRAKRHTAVIEVERRDAYEVADFWEPIAARADKSLILDPDEFYILASNEAVQVPPDYAAEMVPFACIMPASSTPASAMPAPAGQARAPCSKCARAKCRSLSSTARSSAGWSMRKCWRGPTPFTAPASVRTIRRKA
jgi:dCTP deaminase